MSYLDENMTDEDRRMIEEAQTKMAANMKAFYDSEEITPAEREAGEAAHAEWIKKYTRVRGSNFIYHSPMARKMFVVGWVRRGR